jgi:hypothetical protein
MSVFEKAVFCALASWPLASAAQSTYLCPDNGTSIQQLRVYELNRGNRDPFHARFRDHALRLMKKYQFNVVDMWESDSGEKLQLIYLLSWPDRATMDKSWQAFLADREWIDIKKRTGAEHGELVKSAVGQPLVRLSYSPVCKKTAVQ